MMIPELSDEYRDPYVRVGALHALAYCERLFYLEEVEQIRVADAAVFAGRALHAEIEREEGDTVESFTLESSKLGLRGQLDALRRRSGQWIPYEHKKGRSRRGEGKKPEPWPSDRLQVVAYALLLEESSGEPIPEARIRYHTDNVVVRVPIDDAARAQVGDAVARARQLRSSVQRPPVTQNDRACIRCSLAPVCLPEEERLAQNADWEPVQLSPRDDDRVAVHVVSHGSRVGRAGDELRVIPLEGQETKLPIHEVAHVVLHGGAQITTQALHMCAEHETAVSWMTGGGRYVGTLAATGGSVQRRIRQYASLADDATRMSLARRLVGAKVEGQLRFVLRATRGGERRSDGMLTAIESMRTSIRGAHGSQSIEELLGHEGRAALSYFSTWNDLISPEVDSRLRYWGRTRRPPRDRVSALLGFGYALLLKDVVAAILAAGLEPAFGFYHRPRSSAPPLALDLLELFRVPLVDMPVLASINRSQWHPERDFQVSEPRVWLSDEGRKKMIEVYEKRRQEQWKHSVVGYSLSYARMVELEARLLEKEWTGTPGLFARFRLR